MCDSLCMSLHLSSEILMVMFLFIIKSAGVRENVQTSGNGQTGFLNCLHEDTESLFLNIRIATAATTSKANTRHQPERKREKKARNKEIQKE